MTENRRASLISAFCLLLAVLAVACTGNNTSTPAAPSPSCSFSVAQPTTTFGADERLGNGHGHHDGRLRLDSGEQRRVRDDHRRRERQRQRHGDLCRGRQPRRRTHRDADHRRSSFTISQAPAGTTTPAGTLGAPAATSPIGGVTVDPGRPTLVVGNAAATGSVGAVTYRFEVSDLATFPNDAARTFTQDGVAQGSGSTSWTLNRDLGPSVLWYWRARATSGAITGAFSDVATFRTAGGCTYSLSSTSASIVAAGASSTVTVTTDAACAWTATSNSAFITVSSAASATGNGTVTFAVAANTGAARSGTLTIAGQTVTVSQAAAAASAVVASFLLFDPATVSGATTECRFRSPTSASSTCTLRSNSFTTGPTCSRPRPGRSPTPTAASSTRSRSRGSIRTCRSPTRAARRRRPTMGRCSRWQ